MLLPLLWDDIGLIGMVYVDCKGLLMLVFVVSSSEMTLF